MWDLLYPQDTALLRYCALGTKTKTGRDRDRKCRPVLVSFASRVGLFWGTGTESSPFLKLPLGPWVSKETYFRGKRDLKWPLGPWVGDGINLARVGDGHLGAFSGYKWQGSAWTLRTCELGGATFADCRLGS